MSARYSERPASDVIIAGGGPAGVAAALASARAGAKTTLIEAHGCLGGVWTAGQLCWIFEGDNSGVATEIANELERMKARGGGNSFHCYSYDAESMKVLCERLCLEAGAEIRLHTRVADASCDASGRLREIATESKSGRERWTAECFVDCSGDGDLGALAGCSFELGGPNGETQPCTMMGIIAVKDLNAVRDYVSFLDRGPGEWESHQRSQQLLRDAMAKLGIELSYGRPTIFHLRENLLGLMINHEYGVSAIDAGQLSAATLRARAEIYKAVEGLRSLGGVWEGTALAASAEQIGVREGRRLAGLYRVSDEDIAQGARFADGVCLCRFGVDIHSPDPSKGKGLVNMPAKAYQIPYRALVAKDVKGLLMAGRCISGSWLAHASYRVTGTAVSLGEAAGKAAALSALSGRPPHELRWEELAQG